MMSIPFDHDPGPANIGPMPIGSLQPGVASEDFVFRSINGLGPHWFSMLAQILNRSSLGYDLLVGF